MKKTTILFILVALMCSVGFAENEPANSNYKFTSGGFWEYNNETTGGSGEIGFKLVSEDNGFVLRNCIVFEGLGTTIQKESKLNYGAFFINDKILIGGKYNCNDSIIRSYAFLGGGFGLLGCKGHKFIEAPYLAKFYGGGGFEFQFVKDLAFVVEFGGGCTGPIGKNTKSFLGYANSNPTLTIGYRSFK